jgi:hypothetical protein
MAMPADNAATFVTTLSFLEPGPLALVMCASVGPPTWVISVDPMLEELTASLVVNQPVRALAPRCWPSPQEVEASLVDTSSPAIAAQWMTDSPLLPPGQGLP